MWKGLKQADDAQTTTGRVFDNSRSNLQGVDKVADSRGRFVRLHVAAEVVRMTVQGHAESSP